MEEKSYKKKALDFFEIVEQYRADNKEIANNATAIAKLMINDGVARKKSGKLFGPDYFRHVVRTIIDSSEVIYEDEISLNPSTGSAQKWSVDSDENYNWKYTNSQGSKDNLKISVKDADRLFYEFSEHGLNMTQQEIILKHSFTVEKWQSIKNTLRMYKKSNIFSPWTRKHTPDDQLEGMMEKHFDKVFTSEGQMIEKTYEKSLQKAHRKAIKTSFGKEWLIDKIMDSVGDLITKAEPIQVPRYINTKANDHKPKEIVVSLSDMHIGARVEGLKATQDYDLAIARKKFEDAAIEINKYDADKVNIVILGDIIESFTGLSHKNSWQSMEWGMYGAQVVKNAFEILEDFFKSVNNVASITGIGGNHDRMTSDNKEDVQAQIADIIFYFMGRIYGDTFKLDFEPEIAYKEFDGIGYVLTHGHLGLSRKEKTEKIIFRYGNNRVYNVVLKGHIHTRKVENDEREYRVITCAPMFTGNRYSEQLGFTSTAGMTVLYNNGNGLPRVDDIPLE